MVEEGKQVIRGALMRMLIGVRSISGVVIHFKKKKTLSRAKAIQLNLTVECLSTDSRP